MISFSNRNLKIPLLQIYFNITKLFEAISKMKASLFSKPLSQSEYRDNKNAAIFFKRRLLTQQEFRISRYNKYHMQQQWRIQDFPEERVPTPRGAPTYNFAKFSPKLHEIERIWTPGGVHIPHAPLRSATVQNQ